MFNKQPVEGNKVCATCPKSCCNDCAKWFGWFGYLERGDDKNPNIPVEFLLLGKIYRNFKDTSHYDAKEELKRIEALTNQTLKQVEKRLGILIKFSTKTGFNTESGCSLPREMRSFTCKHYTCDILDFAINGLKNTNKTYQEVKDSPRNNYGSC